MRDLIPRRCAVLGVLFLFAGSTPRVVAQTRTPAGKGPSAECRSALTSREVQAIRDVIEAYRTSWLRGDAVGVLATLTSDAVLLPAHGASPVVGTAAIKRYWWPPDSPPVTITKLEITFEDVQGGCGLASVYGRDDVAWTMVDNGVDQAHGHPGTYLNVLRKLPDGSWRIARHMWDDGPSR
jgi:uncharacterized protein (TIGR02246 family)